MADSTADTSQTDQSEPNQNTEDLVKLKAEMDQMRRELAVERSGRESERSARLQAEQRGMSEQERRLLAEETACENAIDSMTREADGIEADIARLADEPGHGAEIAKLNRRLAGVTVRLQNEEGRKDYLAKQRERAKEAPTDNGRKLANGAPISNFKPEVQKWFEDHPRTFSDESYLKKVIAAASYARDVEGIPENTPEYFEFVEARADGRQDAPAQRTARQTDEEGEELDTTVRQPQSRAAGPGSISKTLGAVAPPSRSAASSSGNGSKRQPLLSNDEREAADGLFGHIADRGERYLHYADRRDMMKKMRPSQFGGN